MDRHVANEISRMAEDFGAVRTCVTLFALFRTHVVGVMMQVLMATKKLLLAEALVAPITLMRFFIGMGQCVLFQKSWRCGHEAAPVTLVTFLVLVSLLVLLQRVTIREERGADCAFQRLLCSVLLGDVGS